MECLKAKEELSAYLDDMLSRDEKQQLEQHIAACASCKEELAKLKLYAKTMAGLPKVKAPADFLMKVNDRIERRSEFESVIRGFFKPSANKTRAGAVLVTVVMIFAIYKIVAPQFPGIIVGPVAEKLAVQDQFAQKRVAEFQPQKLDIERKVVEDFGGGVEYEEAADTVAPMVPVASAPIAADTLQLAEREGFAPERTFSKAKAAISEAPGPIKLHASLTAVNAGGSALTLNDAIEMITQSILDAGSPGVDVYREDAGQALLRFNIPSAAYSPFVKQLEQIAAVDGPDSSSVADSGSIDVDLIMMGGLE
jgi:hypothetical protein